MKFERKKDIFYRLLIFGTCILVVGLTIIGGLNGEMEKGEYWVLPVVFILVGLLLWFYFGTNYELNNKELIYRGGPLSGKLSIDRITEIVKGKTMWMGIKYATARKGLIVKFDQYNEIFISPKREDLFVEKLLELNGGIQVKNG